DGEKGDQLVTESKPGKITQECPPEPVIERKASKPDLQSAFMVPFEKAFLAIIELGRFVADPKNAAAKIRTVADVNKAIQTVKSANDLKRGLENLKFRAGVDSTMFKDKAARDEFIGRVEAQLKILD